MSYKCTFKVYMSGVIDQQLAGFPVPAPHPFHRTLNIYQSTPRYVLIRNKNLKICRCSIKKKKFVL